MSSVVYPICTPRYAASSLLVAYGAMTFEAIVAKSQAAGHNYSAAEIRAALIGLRRASLAMLDTSCKRWSLTLSARKYWRAQHAAYRTPQVDQPAPAANKPVLVEDHIDMGMLTRGIVRLSSPADRLPMVYRPGAMDAANLPRIEGPWRVWPDGRRQPREAA